MNQSAVAFQQVTFTKKDKGSMIFFVITIMTEFGQKFTCTHDGHKCQNKFELLMMHVNSSSSRMKKQVAYPSRDFVL